MRFQFGIIALGECLDQTLPQVKHFHEIRAGWDEGRLNRVHALEDVAPVVLLPSRQKVQRNLPLNIIDCLELAASRLHRAQWVLHCDTQRLCPR